MTGVAALSTSDGEVRTWCRDCEGRGWRIIPRMAVLTLGQDLDAALSSGRVTTGLETRMCETCDATGWMPGMSPPT